MIAAGGTGAMSLHGLLFLLIGAGGAPGTTVCEDRLPLAAPQWQVRCKARLEEARDLAAGVTPSLKGVEVKLTFFGYETRLAVGEREPVTAGVVALDARREDETASRWEEIQEEGVKTSTRLMRGRSASIHSSGPRSRAAAFVAAFRPALDECLAMPEWSVPGIEGRIGAAEYRAALLGFLWSARYDPDAERPRDGGDLLNYLVAELAILRGELDALLGSQAGQAKLEAASLTRLRALSERAAKLDAAVQASRRPAQGTRPELEGTLAKALLEKRCADASAALHEFTAAGKGGGQEQDELRLFQLGQCYYEESRPYRACAVLHRLFRRYPAGVHAAEGHLYCGMSYELMCSDPSAQSEYRDALRAPSEAVAARAQEKLKALEARSGDRPR